MKPNPTTDLSPLERRKKIAVREAAALNDLSEASFRRHYAHLIRKITPRRDAVELGDAITLPPPSAARSQRRQRLVAHLHQAGPRSMLEALLEVAAGAPLDVVLESYGRIPSVVERGGER